MLLVMQSINLPFWLPPFVCISAGLYSGMGDTAPVAASEWKNAAIWSPPFCCAFTLLWFTLSAFRPPQAPLRPVFHSNVAVKLFIAASAKSGSRRPAG